MAKAVYVGVGSKAHKMKKAYISSDRKKEWISYLEDLKSTYSRRPALQAELRKL